jgi:hypothetical protein
MEKTPKKFRRGFKPCSKCEAGRHYCCRPLLAGTLCTCDCKKSISTRALKESLDAERVSQGLPQATIEELNEVMNRRGPYNV